MDTSERIRQLREVKGLTQKQFADKVDINQSVMNRIENGRRPVSDEEITKIANFLEVTSDYLLGMESKPNIMFSDGGDSLSDDEEEYLKEELAKYRKMKEQFKKE
ncbi:helix-turn-helix domain-containing protein [Salibacterium lacus]|uniref:Helix-turn-helix domain-containing protein n=1 Tax=Salibacterium lacus TaxID=1898109 RepID=A0ABW5SYK5_9BACI